VNTNNGVWLDKILSGSWKSTNTKPTERKIIEISNNVKDNDSSMIMPTHHETHFNIPTFPQL